MATFIHITRALILMAVFAPGLAAAHGSMEPEDDICVHRVGGNLVHFNAYQPQYDATAQYCTDIPGEGETFLVVDLVDPSLREIPVGVRIVRGLHEAAEDQIVASWSPVTHPDGVVRGEAMLENSLYQVVVLAEGLSPASYPLRVQMTNYSSLASTMGKILIVLPVLTIVVYELSKSRRVRGWWGSRRTEAVAYKRVM